MQYFQGDIIYATLNPRKGHEQQGRRPSLVVSNNSFNKHTNLLKIVPITNHGVEFPLHVKLPEGLKTTGQILTEQEISIDPAVRNVDFIEKCPSEVLEKVLEFITETY